MQGWFNICKSRRITYNISRIKNKNYLFTSIDAEKAFGKIQHPFIRESQNKLGQKDHISV
jgi:hypothetical protein